MSYCSTNSPQYLVRYFLIWQQCNLFGATALNFSSLLPSLSLHFLNHLVSRIKTLLISTAFNQTVFGTSPFVSLVPTSFTTHRHFLLPFVQLGFSSEGVTTDKKIQYNTDLLKRRHKYLYRNNVVN